MINRNLIIILVIAVVALILTLFFPSSVLLGEMAAVGQAAMTNGISQTDANTSSSMIGGLRW